MSGMEMASAQSQSKNPWWMGRLWVWGKGTGVSNRTRENGWMTISKCKGKGKVKKIVEKTGVNRTLRRNGEKALLGLWFVKVVFMQDHRAGKDFPQQSSKSRLPAGRASADANDERFSFLHRDQVWPRPPRGFLLVQVERPSVSVSLKAS